jgi:arylsulfatase A-like enzyme
MRAPYFKTQPDGSRRHVTQIIGDRAIEFLQQQNDADKPFCLSISFKAPHAEDGDKKDHYPVPEVVAGMYDELEVPPARLSDPDVFKSHPEFFKQSMHRERFGWRWDTPEKYARNMRGYWGMISGVDHVVGRIVKEIRKIGAAENTVLIFTGDNGYYLGQRGFAGKWSHYEESLRVPLVIYDPCNRAEGGERRVIKETALNIDLAATMLEMGGVDVPRSYHGRSLTGLLKGKAPSSWRTEFLCEHLFHIPGRIPKYEGVRGHRWTYARYFEQEPVYEFLHDLNEDPDQLKNYALDPAFTQQLDSMRKACDALIMRNGGPYSLEKFPLKNHRTKNRRTKRKQKQKESATEPNKQSRQGVERKQH